ncbi:MAG: hypothetical protein IT287_08640, partial [Bdellovibrionaceae bacterium]|nr:hypothetical protein [Pseudobdellovibrionaceae bacterium]
MTLFKVFLKLIPLFISTIFCASTYAQSKDLSDEPGTKYLIMYQGIEREETLSAWPPNLDIGGDYG